MPHRLRCFLRRCEFIRPRIYRTENHLIVYGPKLGGDNLRYVLHIDGDAGRGGDVWCSSERKADWKQWGRLKLSRREWLDAVRYALTAKGRA